MKKPVIILICLALCVGLFLLSSEIFQEELASDAGANEQGEILPESEKENQQEKYKDNLSKEPSEGNDKDNMQEGEKSDSSKNGDSKTEKDTEIKQKTDAGKEKERKTVKEETQIICFEKDQSEDEISIAIAESVAKDLSVERLDKQFIISYSHDDIPEDYHLSVKLTSYNKEGATIDRYVSDGGWLSDPGKYNPAGGTYRVKVEGAEQCDSTIVARISVRKNGFSETHAIFQIEFK